MRRIAAQVTLSLAVGCGSTPGDEAADIALGIYRSGSVLTASTAGVTVSHGLPERVFVEDPPSPFAGEPRKLYPWRLTDQGAAGYGEDVGRAILRRTGPEATASA